MTFRALLTIGLVLIFAERLPAPIQEQPESTPTPKPKRETVVRPKPKPEATAKPKATPNHSFAGTWTGSAPTIGTSETSFYVIKISDDEKIALINWRFGGDATGRDYQATCTRFGKALSWNLKGENSTWHCMQTLELNSNGTAAFSSTMTTTNGGPTFRSTGTFSRK
jgi:hypothetical protein